LLCSLTIPEEDAMLAIVFVLAAAALWFGPLREFAGTLDLGLGGFLLVVVHFWHHAPPELTIGAVVFLAFGAIYWAVRWIVIGLESFGFFSD
jgi:hypothetical protein